MAAAPPPPEPTDVRLVLSQCTAACERALSRYADRVGLGGDNELVRSLVYAMAAVATAAEYLGADTPQKQLALRLAVDVCRRAASTCRRYGLERDLLLCAAACDRAAAEAELVLASAA